MKKMLRCPTCGSPIAQHGANSDWLLDILTRDPDRFIYRGRDGGWWLTKSRGELDPNVVRDLIRRGAIVSCYSDCPDDAYHVGKTIDIPRTMEERKKHRRKRDAPKIYTDGSTDTGSVT